MFGIELQELFLFGKQLGLSLLGAAGLWGFVFTKISKHHQKKEVCIAYEWTGTRLLFPLVAGAAITIISWILISILPAYAHEGIVLVPTQEHIALGMQVAMPAMVLWGIVLASALGLYTLKPQLFQKEIEWFYLSQLVFAVFLMLLFAWQGAVDKAQFFFWGHSVHSILTIGTVLVLDFLFLISKSSRLLQQHVYPLFPTLSKVIWIGLGIDFLSVALVFSQAIELTPKFFFMQTVIGILIINGTLLAGPITRKLIASVQKQGVAMQGAWKRAADIAGVVSIASWGSNTFVDFFENLTLTYPQLLATYIGIIILLFIGHLVFEHFERQNQANWPTFVHHS
jgi:hypothetical protein